MYGESLGNKVDTLDKAYRCMELAASSGSSSPLKLALAYAAIAQAEALQLIAKRLEQWMSVQGVLPEFFEAVSRAKQYDE
jgi:hypothetical protein